MRESFPDRRDVLFGREEDLAYLLRRSESRGVTAVVGRAQMGKSSLLTELARRLSEDAGRAGGLLQLPPCMVGYTESLGETADLLLRTIVNLYARWLAESSYSEQAKVVFEQHKKDFVSTAGEAVGTIFEQISKLGHKPMEVVGGLVKKTFEGLASVNRELVSGGIQLPQLQIEQGRELLEIVYRITGRPIVLIFDQWEKSPGLELEGNILDSFVRHLDDWPRCHIILGSRREGKPYAKVNAFQMAYPTEVEMYELPPMRFADSVAEGAFLRFIREKVPVATEVGDEELLEMISGYPGTVNRWTKGYAARQIHSVADLKKLADDANSYRYGEFDDLFRNQLEQARVLSMRLVLLPSTGSIEGWRALKEIVMEEIKPRELDALKKSDVLLAISPPTYGHAKRSEAALKWLSDNSSGELQEVCERLIYKLGGRIRDTTPQVVPFASSLVNLVPVASRLEVSTVAQGICQAALSLYGSQGIDHHKLQVATVEARNGVTQAVALLAMGLLNTLNYAQQEDALERRDGLLEELRQLAQAYPQDGSVRDSLANGLFNGLVYAEQEEAPERRDALLEELRQLAHVYPRDGPVREQLAKGLYNTLNYADQEDALERRDGLLEELRQLAHVYPQDGPVRENLADGLYNTLNYAQREDALERRDGLLEELRQLAQAYPQDGPVRDSLAMGLFNTLNDSKQKQALKRRDGLLEELRQLAQTYPQDGTVRESLAKGLGKTAWDSREEGDPVRCDGLLNELRQLAKNFSEDEIVHKLLELANSALAEGKDG